MKNRIIPIIGLLACLGPWAGMAGQEISYDYDNAGRLILASYGAKTISYTYDNNGNLTRRVIQGGEPCFDVAVFQAALPTWTLSRDVRDLILLIECPKAAKSDGEF